MCPPPGAAEPGRHGGRGSPLLLPRVGLPRERPHLADPVSAQGSRPAAARCSFLSGPRSVRPGVRLSWRRGAGGHDATSRAAGVRFRRAHDHDVLPCGSLPLLVHARESPRHEPPVPAPGHRRQDQARAFSAMRSARDQWRPGTSSPMRVGNWTAALACSPTRAWTAASQPTCSRSELHTPAKTLQLVSENAGWPFIRRFIERVLAGGPDGGRG
jgi:hypothetical protein